MSTPSPRLAAALAYAGRNLKVFPLRPWGKVPLTRHGLKDATTDPTQLKAWWQRWPDANLGLAVPKGYLVVDVDSPEALPALRALDQELPATATAYTARGQHFWYSAMGTFVRNGVGILPGVDLRAHGGYVVAPPSVHESGALYTWAVPLKRSTIAPCPAWLMEHLQEQQTAKSNSPEAWRRLITQPVAQGQRNHTLARVAGLLFRKHPAEVAADFAYCWAQVRLQPPLPEPEVLRTIGSIANRELRRRGGEA